MKKSRFAGQQIAFAQNSRGSLLFPLRFSLVDLSRQHRPSFQPASNIAIRR